MKRKKLFWKKLRYEQLLYFRPYFINFSELTFFTNNLINIIQNRY